jgi:hypothetical protein
MIANVWIHLLSHCNGEPVIGALVTSGLEVSILNASGKFEHYPDQPVAILALKITTVEQTASDLNNRIKTQLVELDVKYYSILVVYPVMSGSVLQSSWHHSNIRLSDYKKIKQERTARIAQTAHVRLVPPPAPKEPPTTDQ